MCHALARRKSTHNQLGRGLVRSLTQHSFAMASNKWILQQGVGRIRLKCKNCNFRARTRAILSLHICEHHGDTLHECPEPNCTFKSTWKGSVNRHRRERHGDHVRWPITCDICANGTVFQSEKTLQMHKKLMHEPRPRPTYQCSECGKLFTNKSYLKIHQVFHQKERPYECFLCGARFKESTSLNSHIKFIHCENRNKVCPSCPKAFTRQCDLARHIRSVHEKKKPHKCTFCNYAAAEKLSLKRHLKSIHNANVVLCPICRKPYPNEVLLRRHLLCVHKQIKYHKCTMCDYVSFTKSNLERHCEKVHVNVSDSMNEMTQFDIPLPELIL